MNSARTDALPAPNTAEQVNPLEAAFALAVRGFHVFPLAVGSKVPLKNSRGHLDATDDLAQVRTWFTGGNANVGIRCDFVDDRPIFALDVDGPEGFASLEALESQHGPLPPTLTSITRRGRHLIFFGPESIRSSASKLAPGLDVRASDGYIVGPGSVVDGYRYHFRDPAARVAEAPDWLFSLAREAGGPVDRAPIDRTPLPGVDLERAKRRAIDFLKAAPPAIEGEGGDSATFKMFARLKDFGVPEIEALFLADEHWNGRCSPPWRLEDLAAKASNAFRYGREPLGVSAPEAIFETAKTEDGRPSPLEALNQEYAFVPLGRGVVLHEHLDAKGRYRADPLALEAFHQIHANRRLQAGDTKPRPVSKLWMEWQGRRQYEGIVFAPGQDPGPRWFNLWRGFTVEPAPKASHPALDAFLEHARLNVCCGDETLFRWLMGYFAHMVQRPSEKPLVALVFKGRKGTGKNALVERVGALLGRHFLVADDDRYLLSNFNAHLESCLCLVLDEATWAGDKKAEGRLKGIITGSEHLIERKGLEPYRVDNLTRVAILGNEEWLVPATLDERRFAVFTMGEGRMQDRKFFESMRVGMEQGGYAHLLRFLLDFDLSTVDVNDAPKTRGLAEQKLATLRGPTRWLIDALDDGCVPGWPWNERGMSVPKNAAYRGYSELSRSRYREHHPADPRAFWKEIRALIPVRDERPAKGDRERLAIFPPLAEAREKVEAAVGGEIPWAE